MPSAATAGPARLGMRPLVGAGRWRRFGPFAGIAAAGPALAYAAGPRHPGAVLLAVLVLAAMVAALAWLPWHRWAVRWQAAPLLACFLAAVLLGYGIGSYAEFTFLTVLPVIWLVLYHTRALLAAGIAVFALVRCLPAIAFPETFGALDRAEAATAVAVTVLAGLLGHVLVSRSRAAAEEAATAARQAREQRELLRTYLDAAGCLMIVADDQGRVALFNRASERVTGYTAAEVTGRPLWEFGVPASCRASFTRALQGGPPVSHEADWVTKRGDVRRISWTEVGLADATGRVTHVIGSGLDITEQRAAEHRFANVLAAATEQIILATDTRGVITVFNGGAEQMLGYTAAEVVGRHRVDLIHRTEELEAVAREAGVASIGELFRSDAPPMATHTRDWTLVRRDGTTLPVSMTHSEMRHGGRRVGYVAVGRDVSAERRAVQAMATALDREREAVLATTEALERERQAADRLRELDQVRNDFVATVSHDLRTPLTSIVGNTELLLDGEAGELAPPQRRLLEAVERNGRRLDALISDLLMLSRLESGAVRMNSRIVQLSDVVNGALERLTAHRTADVGLEVGLWGEPLFVQGDPDQLERVVTNLLGNAMKFTPPGGRVTVRVEAVSGRARVRVSDTGIGIPDNELPYVFDRFYRSSRSQQRDRPGTGLGLTIAKSIVEQHGGTITAATNPASGATFTIELPLLTVAAERSEREPA